MTPISQSGRNIAIVLRPVIRETTFCYTVSGYGGQPHPGGENQIAATGGTKFNLTTDSGIDVSHRNLGRVPFNDQLLTIKPSTCSTVNPRAAGFWLSDHQLSSIRLSTR
jgi:hypothetical protein